MERVTVRVYKHEAIAGRFPDICAISGARADNSVKRHLVSPSTVFGSLPLVLLPFGQVLYVVTIRRAQVEIRVPLSHLEAARVGARDRSHKIARLLAIFLPFGVLLGAIPAFAAEYRDLGPIRFAGLAAGSLAFLGAVIWTVRTRDPLRCRIRGEDVVMEVHPTFAVAVERRSPGAMPFAAAQSRPVQPFGVQVPSGPPALPAWGASTGPGTPAAPVQPAVPPSWAPDPSGRFAVRWWDGTAWTANVVDHTGRQLVDG